MGGDVVRVYELGKITGTNTESLASVFIDRFTGMITLTIVSLVAVLVSLREHDLPIITYSLAVCVFLISILIWLMLDRRPLALFSNLITGRFESLTPLIQKLARTHDAVRAYKDNLPTLWYTFAISLLFYFLAVINVWVSALAFSREVEFLTILVAVPAIMLIMNLPVSIGGLGLMEAAYTIIFTSFGYSSGLAVSTALLIRLKTLIDGVVGSIFTWPSQNLFPNPVKHPKQRTPKMDKYSEYRFDNIIQDPDRSFFHKYQDLVIGNRRIGFLFYFEVCTVLFNPIQGMLGLALRKLLFPPLFGRVGRRVVFGHHISIRSPGNIQIGNNTVIDDFTTLSVRGSTGQHIQLGDNVLIGRLTMLKTRGGSIEIADHVHVGPNCHLGTASTLLIGEYSLSDRTVPSAGCIMATRTATNLSCNSHWTTAAVSP
jgi:hypothetical protein